MGRRFLSGLLQFVVFVPLLLGACTGPGVLYLQSARWVAEPAPAKPPFSFFVAFRDRESGALGVQPLGALRRERRPGAEFRLPPGTHEVRVEEIFAEIEVADVPGGGQRVRVYVVGDTPWASLSEYRVRNGRIEPLRHGHSSPWVFLAGFGVCLALLGLAMKPIRRFIDRLLGCPPGEGVSPG